MALVFPRPVAEFADKLRLSSVKFWLDGQEEFSGLGSGEFLAADLGPKIWKADVTITELRHADASEVQALIESMDGSIGTFYLYDIRKQYPRLDRGGVTLGAANPVIASIGANRKSLSVSGLPAGYVLSVGDLFHFDYGSNPARRAFHRVAEVATANGSGITNPFEIRPHLKAGAAVGQAIKLVKPAPKMKIIPGSFDPGTGENVFTSGMRFQAQQTL
ncbi:MULTISPECIES: hypothetical protein [unclassified Ensifer]|uniref:hypothetical protein n=1 Tax=unclassified Ensifer TaxID=2633371 RepID=UPI000812F440|nr:MULTISPECIES: hypothetical protein [unclassified Ensifer]OCP04996.1 hypothetical protein BC362_14650 [Ensifer sp. LC14]OCP11845.1 hypothetical protein BC374_16355 [Ensifer sp. LC13]OCP12402.1 hypothetical protein BBX50_16555 [Ensifer sp. LC11]OCP33631.1 hypothetical protein BC364_15290 [Ensifer sp. LC499]